MRFAAEPGLTSFCELTCTFPASSIYDTRVWYPDSLHQFDNTRALSASESFVGLGAFAIGRGRLRLVLIDDSM